MRNWLFVRQRNDRVKAILAHEIEGHRKRGLARPLEEFLLACGPRDRKQTADDDAQIEKVSEWRCGFERKSGGCCIPSLDGQIPRGSRRRIEKLRLAG